MSWSGDEFWGKLEKDGQNRMVGWLSLEDHCCDVGSCCEAILKSTHLTRRLAALGQIALLSSGQIARLAALAALHDLGKYNLAFQAKADPEAKKTAGHVNEILSLCDGAVGYSETAKLCAAIDFATIEGWGKGETAFSLLIASFAHHGRPLPVGQGHRDEIWRPRDGRDPFAGMAHLWALIQTWFPEAFAGDVEPFPEQPAFVHAFNGLVTLADWLASDTRFFPFDLLGHCDRRSFSRQQAREAVKAVGLDVLQARLHLGEGPVRFDLVSPFPPRPAQEAILGLPREAGGSAVVLEAETGAGKTEAALVRFLELFRTGEVDGLYFALPTRTSATQMFSRVRSAVERAFPDPALRPNVILAVPGYIAVDQKLGKALPDFEVLWDDDPQGLWRRRGWAAESPKRFLAGTVVVGTIDQILLGGLKVAHAHLRLAMALRHLLVVDEVHASDPYMNRLLEHVLKIHIMAGGHALLMSATLGCETRQRLLRPGVPPSVPGLEDASRRPFPSVTYARAGTDPVDVGVPVLEASKEIGVALLPFADDPGRIAEQVNAWLREGARVLVLRNTVADCVRAQAAIEELVAGEGRLDHLFQCAGRFAPHHSRFAKEDREILDRELERAFGNGSPNTPRVVVATQTVQQSLDLDFDVILTDLCPMDVLLQRVGRVHRHIRAGRPPACAMARLEVLVPSERDLGRFIRKGGEACGPHGIGTVYQDLRILEATWRVLEARERLAIPEMNRDLVERTTHPQALTDLVETLGEAWVRHDASMKGIRSAQQGVAALNLLRWDVPFGDQESLFPSDELERRLATRLGADDRLIRFESPVAGPFGEILRGLTIPAYLVEGAAPEDLPREVTGGDGVVRFTFGKADYLYDRWGLRRAGDQPRSGGPEEETDA
ncbi:MAG: CRISPR-associated helicase Cas3' [Candidatus Riflebacteria bacterium]|nr:CRISPR-associated helicase Cas3' [Candidatus Riflebacteria bacterium]